MHRLASLSVSVFLINGFLLVLPALGSEPTALAPADGESPLIEVLRSTADGLTLAFELPDLPLP